MSPGLTPQIIVYIHHNVVKYFLHQYMFYGEQFAYFGYCSKADNLNNDF